MRILEKCHVPECAVSHCQSGYTRGATSKYPAKGPRGVDKIRGVGSYGKDDVEFGWVLSRQVLDRFGGT